MTISDETKKELRYAKNLTVTSKFIILYRGTSVVILDKQFNLLKKIPKMDSVYNGYVSPDEKKLLLVGTTNHAYLVSLESLDIELKYTAKQPYLGNLEGHACWSTKKDTFILPVQRDKKPLLSTIREINYTQGVVCKDFLTEKYWIVYVTYVECQNQYLAIGLDRNSHTWNLIWWDEQYTFTTKKILDYDGIIFDINLNQEEKRITLTGVDKIYVCDFDGKPSDSAQIPVGIDIYKILYDVSIRVSEVIFIKRSEMDPDILFIGTGKSLIVWQLSKGVLVKEFPYEFGAHGVIEISKNVFAVSTWSGVKILEI